MAFKAFSVCPQLLPMLLLLALPATRTGLPAQNTWVLLCPVPLLAMFSFPTEWVTNHGEHPGPHEPTLTLALPEGILGFDGMSPVPILYLIHLTTSVPTMGPHRKKNIWEWFLPHTHT